MPARLLTEVAAAAGRVFTDKGFRSAGISDVSAALGLSHGAVYTYVDSKQALLFLALVRAVHPDRLATLATPVTAPPQQEIVALAETWASQAAGFPVLTAACADPPSQSVDQELGGIIDELYAFIEDHREILKLVERCAADLPELAQWFFVQRRRSNVGTLAAYLRQRIGSGLLRPVPDVPVAARFIVETVAWFAMHRHDDPDSAMLDDTASRHTVRHLLLAAFLPATVEATLDAGSRHGRDR